MTTKIKHSKHDGFELIKEILGPVAWKNEKGDEALKIQVNSYPSLKHDFVVRDDMSETEDKVKYLFEEFDDPFSNMKAIEAMVNIENAINEMPSDIQDSIGVGKARQLATYFSTYQAIAQWQYSVFFEKFKRYENGVNFLYNEKVTQKLTSLEKDYSKKLGEVIECLEPYFNERDVKIEEMKAKRLKERNEYVKQLEEDETLTSMEIKNLKKEFDGETYTFEKDLTNRYSEKAYAKKNLLNSEAAIINKFISKSYAESAVIQSEGYNELTRKFRIIETFKNYFYNRMNELGSFIITCNSIAANKNVE